MQHSHCDGEFRRDQRIVAQDRKFFDNKANVAIGLYQIFDFGIGFAAIAAAIVHELDDGDRPVWIAANPTGRILENSCRIGLQHCNFSLLVCLCLAVLKNLHHLHDHLGIIQQILPHFVVKGLLFGGRHLAQASGKGGKGNQAKRQGEGEAAHGKPLISAARSRLPQYYGPPRCGRTGPSAIPVGPSQ